MVQLMSVCSGAPRLHLDTQDKHQVPHAACTDCFSWKQTSIFGRGLNWHQQMAVSKLKIPIEVSLIK